MLLLTGAPVHAGASTSGFDVSGLDRIVASLGTVEAAEVLTAHRERVDRRKQARALAAAADTAHSTTA